MDSESMKFQSWWELTLLAIIIYSTFHSTENFLRVCAWFFVEKRISKLDSSYLSVGFYNPEKRLADFTSTPNESIWCFARWRKKLRSYIFYLKWTFVDISGVPFEGICLMSIVLEESSIRSILSVAFLKVAAARSQVEEAYVCCELVSW